MDVAVPLIWRHRSGMLVRLVRVVAVDVFVRVFDHGVAMFMRMALAQMQSYPDQHQQATSTRGVVTGSPNKGTDNKAPAKGATEK